MSNKSAHPEFDPDLYIPGISIDCVIFGYHQKKLKVLILEYRKTNLFALPGGFLGKDESLDDAAARILYERTGLSEIYLNQFYTFGGLSRDDPGPMKKIMAANNIHLPDDHWLMQRFISIAYYALVDYRKTQPEADMYSDSCRWYDFKELPDLMLDHYSIFELALGHLRDNIDHKATGLNLLEDNFTMGDLRNLYETILGEEINRSAFHRKMIRSGKLKRIGKKKTGKSHRSPYLYKFDLN